MQIRAPMEVRSMDRIIEEHTIDSHQVTIIEEIMDEGVGYGVVVDEVKISEDEPLDHLPSEEEIRGLLRTHVFR